MKMYIPFGDWSNDGHGRYDKVLIDAPSMDSLHEAQKRICIKYGKNFFDVYAKEYEEPELSEIIWQALIDTKYPIERMIQIEEINDWKGMSSLEEVLAADPNPSVCLEFVEDTFIWLLNAFGAEITKLEEREAIPIICNWTCPGFQTVGYGCFY